MAEALRKLNVPVTVVLDAAVGWVIAASVCPSAPYTDTITYLSLLFLSFSHRYVLEKVDLVIVGAEGVVESGGIINKVNDTEVEIRNN